MQPIFCLSFLQSYRKMEFIISKVIATILCYKYIENKTKQKTRAQLDGIINRIYKVNDVMSFNLG